MAHKGNIPWNKNLTKNTDKRVEQNVKKTAETLKKMHANGELKIWNKDKTGLQISCRKGKKYPHNDNCSCCFCKAKNGNFVPWNKSKTGLQIGWSKGLTKENNLSLRSTSDKLRGIKRNEEFKKKVSEARLKYFKEHPYRGHLWIDGRSPSRYGPGFTKRLKKQIFDRDGGICQMCHELIWNGHCIHHINYDVDDHDVNNLVLLCKSCHGKTNGNRNYWFNFFKV